MPPRKSDGAPRAEAKRGQPPKGKTAMTYRYQPELPVYQHLQAEAERFDTSLQEEMHRALVDWFTGKGHMQALPVVEPVESDDVDDEPSAGARAAADTFM